MNQKTKLKALRTLGGTFRVLVIFLRAYFTITTSISLILYIAILITSGKFDIIEFYYSRENNIMATLTGFLVFFIVCFLLEIIFAPELKNISWKNTLVVSIILFLLFAYKYLQSLFITQFLIPIFGPILLFLFWFYFKYEQKLFGDAINEYGKYQMKSKNLRKV